VAAITIPIGRIGATSEPAGMVIAGPRISHARLIALADAIEQGLKVGLTPDLEKSIAEIDAVTGRQARLRH
jgi:Asp-tRNA(Asn)/Glu-tRNA(Gln) amidotransferase A subunit family amidase